MNKTKIISFCLLVLLCFLIASTFLRIKHKEEYRQKVVLAHEIHKVLGYLMFDLREARESTIQDVPPDGQWHKRIAFIQDRQGALEYLIKEGHLFRINKGTSLLIADNIADMRIRRLKETPGILEVQIEARSNVSLMTYLKIRVRQ